MKRSILFLVVVLFVFATSVSAQTKAVKIALFNPLGNNEYVERR